MRRERPTGELPFVSNECAVARPREESGVDEGAEDGFAGRFVEPPEPLRLLECQSQSRHFEILTADSPHDLLNSKDRLAQGISRG